VFNGPGRGVVNSPLTTAEALFQNVKISSCHTAKKISMKPASFYLLNEPDLSGEFGTIFSLGVK